MSRSSRTAGARAAHRTASSFLAHHLAGARGNGSPRRLLVAVAACGGTGLLLAACSSSALSGSTGAAAHGPAVPLAPLANAPASGAYGVASRAGSSQSAGVTALTNLAP